MSDMTTTQQNGGVPAKTSGQRTLKDLLEQARSSIAQVLPRHLTPDRIVKVALSATSRNTDLAKCTAQSILKAVMQAAELGLEPGGLLGHAYLVPFNNKVKLPDGRDTWIKECQLIVGYRGYIDLARRSGEVSTIEAHVVHENDVFRVEYGLESRLIHEPNFRENRGEMVCVYGIVKLKDGGYQLEVMSREDIAKIKARSKAAKFGPWVTDESEMWRKTVLRRLLKYAPLSSELARRAQEHDESHDAPIDMALIEEHSQIEETPEAKGKTRGRALAQKIAAKAEETQTPQPIETAPTEPAPADDEAPMDPDQGP